MDIHEARHLASSSRWESVIGRHARDLSFERPDRVGQQLHGDVLALIIRLPVIHHLDVERLSRGVIPSPQFLIRLRDFAILERR